jgi:hypothetical protein
MRYRAETFALYDVLFTEAHQALVKEGTIKEARGMFARLGGRLSAMGEAWRASSPATIAARRQAEELAAHQAKMTEMAQALGAADKSVAETAAKHKALQQNLTAEQAARKTEQDQVTHEMKQYKATPGALTRAQRLRNVGLVGTGLGVAGVPAAYYAGRSGAEEKGRTTRNLAFGAGAAAGLAAPQLVSGLGAIANSAGQTGLFPDLQSTGFDPNNPQGNY